MFMCGREREGGREERLLLQEVFHTDERRKSRELHLCVKNHVPCHGGLEMRSPLGGYLKEAFVLFTAKDYNQLMS